MSSTIDEIGRIIDLLRHRPNVLLIGADEAIESAMSEFEPWLLRPVHAVSYNKHAFTTTIFPTLLIRNVNELTWPQQEQLAAFIGATGGKVQVISTSRDPLYPDVCRGLFLQTLYYRLNGVVLHV